MKRVFSEYEKLGDEYYESLGDMQPLQNIPLLVN